MEEIWKAIPGYEGYYEVSNTGKVRSVTRTIISRDGKSRTFLGEIKNPTPNKHGYQQVGLHKDGKRKVFLVHRLVAITFLPNPDNLPVVNHKDENPSNNNVNNLEWCTSKYNSNYGTSIQRMAQNTLGKHTKKVWKCNKCTHERIELFDSIGEAAEKVRGDKEKGLSTISKCANGHQPSAYGYYWEFD
jgi:hypothetical protein